MKKKVLFLLPSFRKGGEAKNTLNILNSLDTDRFDSTLLICSKDENDLKILLEKNITIVEVESSGNVIRAFWKILKAIYCVRPDITFTSFTGLNYLVGIYKVFSFRNVVSILRFNTLPSNKIPSSSDFSYTGKKTKFSVRSANHIIAQSPEMLREILTYYPKSKGKVQVILNAVNHQQIARLSKEYIPYENYNGTTLVSVGSLWEVKGFDYLIRAVGELINRHNQAVRLFIVGENLIRGSHYDGYLQGLITGLGLENHVFLEGYTSNPYPYMKHADVFALPSLKEGFPNVVLEALSLQVPCVVTDCVDFSDIIVSGSNGYIVKQAHVGSLVEGILNAKDIDIKLKTNANFDYNGWLSEFCCILISFHLVV